MRGLLLYQGGVQKGRLPVSWTLGGWGGADIVSLLVFLKTSFSLGLHLRVLHLQDLGH